MKKIKNISLEIIIILLFIFISKVASKEIPRKQKNKFYLFLLIGQSNMAGRGEIEPRDKIPVERLFSLDKAGKWVPAVDPIHFDKKFAGVGPARSFGILATKKYPYATIGLIPCACGGSPISKWTSGAYHSQTQSKPYDDAIKRARKAMKDGILKGILWHQGESDCSPEKATVYKRKLTELIFRFRKELNAPNVPFIIGQLGKFKPWSASRKAVDKAQKSVANEIKNVIFVNSDGLDSKEDKVHFDATSQREFGKRYFDAYLRLAE